MNKKTFILGIIAIAFLSGIFYYSSKKTNLEDQTASVLETQKQEISQNALFKEFFLGNPDAPVTLVDYSSHLCGHCVNFHKENLPLLINKYVKTGKLKIIPRLLSPVELGMAVLCAHEQNGFVSMNEYLFDHVRELESMDDLKSVVNKIGLDQANFNICIDSNKHEEMVVQWFNQAEQAGVEGTPTFLINDHKIVGNQPLSEFEKIIEQELANQ